MKELTYFSPERLAQLIGRFGRLRIAVVGDFFLDKYLDVDPALAELSIETGKTANQVVAVRHSPGAAGTIVGNLAALGAGELHAVGFTGDDGESYDLRRDLAGAAAARRPTSHSDPERMTPTYLKPRDATDPGLAGEHNRYDTKNRTPTSAAAQERIIAGLDALLPQVDAVIAMDQVDEEGCGVVTPMVVEALADRAARHPKVIFWADSRRRIRRFRGVIIKPNQLEAAGIVEQTPGKEVDLEQLCAAVGQLRREVGARSAPPAAPRACWSAIRSRSWCPACGSRARPIRPAPVIARRRGPCWRWLPAPPWPRPPWSATWSPRSPSSSLRPPARPAPSNCRRGLRCGSRQRLDVRGHGRSGADIPSAAALGGRPEAGSANFFGKPEFFPSRPTGRQTRRGNGDSMGGIPSMFSARSEARLRFRRQAEKSS